MEKYIIDASVFVAILNKNEPKHQACMDFLLNLHLRYTSKKDVQAFQPIHSLIEATISHQRRKRGGKVEPIDPMNIKGLKLYSIDEDFLRKVEHQNLYDIFNVLRSSDAIYAMIAYLEDMTLVTLDSDFEKVSEKIRVIRL